MFSVKGGLLWTFFGSFIIAGGMSIAGIAAFDGQFLLTFIGFLVFFAGYRISQRQTRHVNFVSIQPCTNLIFQKLTVIAVGRLTLVLLGGLLAAHGVTLFAETIVRPDASKAVLAGFTCICGYMSTHTGINKTLL